MGLSSSSIENKTLFDTLPKDVQWLQMFYLQPNVLPKHPSFQIYKKDPVFCRTYIKERYYQQRDKTCCHCLNIDAITIQKFLSSVGAGNYMPTTEQAYELAKRLLIDYVEQLKFIKDICYGDYVDIQMDEEIHIYLVGPYQNGPTVLEIKDNILPLGYPEFPIGYFDKLLEHHLWSIPCQTKHIQRDGNILTLNDRRFRLNNRVNKIGLIYIGYSIPRPMTIEEIFEKNEIIYLRQAPPSDTVDLLDDFIPEYNYWLGDG